MKALHMVAFALTVVGALNWGLVGLLNYNLVNVLLVSYPALETLVYVLVGASGVVMLVTHKQTCKSCG